MNFMNFDVEAFFSTDIHFPISWTFKRSVQANIFVKVASNFSLLTTP